MKDGFLRSAFAIALPVSLQSMLQSSFSMIDQLMVGQLGMREIAAVEVGGKCGFVLTFVIGAVATVASIMISQYIGKKDNEAAEKSVSVNLLAAFAISLAFFSACRIFPHAISSFFTADGNLASLSALYLKTVSFCYLFSGVSAILAVLIRCKGRAAVPLYISIASALVNTGLNWLLIFGRGSFPKMGIQGAALASVVSQAVNALLLAAAFFRLNGRFRFSLSLGKEKWIQYCAMLFPVLANEFLWSIGQNVFTSIYGHLGTEELAAMSLTGPVQGLFIGALSGLSQAAGILIGKRLGEGEREKAYSESKRLCLYGLLFSLALSCVLILLRAPYTALYRVEGGVQKTGGALLLAFASLAPVKVLNMILGGGILRSGGRTKFITLIDQAGTWLVGVPLAALTGIVLRLPVVWVYFILSQEEAVRLLVSAFVFSSRKWMNTLA